MFYFGDDLKERMILLGFDTAKLAELTFIEPSEIEEMINNEIPYNEIDDFDMSLICNALHCDTKYFVDSSVKSKDLVYATMNRGNDTQKSRTIKAKIQDFIKDYTFINEVYSTL